MIRAVIIDDERNALEVLQLQLQQYCKEVEILAICQGGKAGSGTCCRGFDAGTRCRSAYSNRWLPDPGYGRAGQSTAVAPGA